jgi:hypothetical protein
LKQQFFVGDTAARSQIRAHPRADNAAKNAQKQNRRDEREQTDTAGARGGEFLVGAEPAKNQERRREQTHRQRKNQNERNQQHDGFGKNSEPRVAANEQRENVLKHVAQQQNKREYRHGQQQRGEHLAGQVFVQRFQISRKTSVEGRRKKNKRDRRKNRQQECEKKIFRNLHLGLIFPIVAFIKSWLNLIWV